MRFRTLVIAAALSTGFAPHKGAERQVVVAGGRAPRTHRDVAFTKLAGLVDWRVMMDRDTGVPLRMWGPSIAAAGSSSDPAVAEAAARQFLATHLDVLAPGAAPADFVLVANVVNPTGDVRTVAFVQRAQGLEVVGGSIGFAFQHDHLTMVSSTALPNVAVRTPAGAMAPPAIESAAIGWLAQAGHSVAVRGVGTRVIVPIVRPRGQSGPDIEYRVAETVTVEARGEPGKWDVWIDAGDGSPIARRNLISYASGVVQYNVPDRYPLGARGGKPAPFATTTVNGVVGTTALDGTITWSGTAAATIIPGLTGTYAAITNVAGALVTGSLTLPPGGTVVWDQSTNEQADAQLDAYVYENTVKQFVLTKLNPGLTWAMGQISVNVNENMTCNAYSTGDDVHFFIAAPGMCENTGRVSDVIYHETGHSVHYNSIIPGQGQFDGSLSEGLADTMAVSITGDHGMGRGFFLNDNPLRDVAPAVKKRYPQDYDGEVHDDGEIIGEALWDTRVALEAKLGTAAGDAQIHKIYYGIMQRAADIPSTYAEALVADDDDGNLANGTPNQCEIEAAFGAHGLADPSASIGLTAPTRDAYTISFTVNPPQSSCTPPTVSSAVINWTPRGGSGTQLALAATGNTWSAQIPTQPDGTVVLYSVTITLSDGSTLTYPDNPADPQYQFYVGPVTTIQCFDFESGIGDWTHSAMPVANDEWAVGTPLGVGGDPTMAHGGSNVLGIDLGADDGMYSPRTKQWAESPDIDLLGNTNVHLQYWRWLTVEDGAYDNASISANDTAVWNNFASPGQPTTEVNHVDKEWRFQDVDLSAQTTTGKIKLKFELDSDDGLELGGWNIDDVCVVAIGAAAPLCGNGTVDPGEQCDDGNTTDGDGCSATCQDETKGKMGGGCCSVGTDPVGALGLSVLTLGLLIRRRRRR